MIPPAMVIAPMVSPNPGPGGSGTMVEPAGIIADAIKSYNRIGGAKGGSLDDPTALMPEGEFDREGNFLVAIL